LLFFGSASMIMLIAGAAIFARPLIEFIDTGLVTRFPSLFVSIALIIMALLSGVCGVIVDSIRKQTRTFYELELYRLNDSNR